MDTLIVLGLVLSSSLASPQQYVAPLLPDSHHLQTPRVFNPLSAQINPLPAQLNPLPAQINNAFSPNHQLGQGSPPATVPAQQALHPIHNNQDQFPFGLQTTQNNQDPALNSLQGNIRTNNEYGQNIQNGFSNINNVNNDVPNNDYASNSGNGNGQTTISNIGFNNDQNNPIRVSSNIGHFNHGTDSQSLPITPNGSFNRINGNNVDPNGNMNELFTNNLAGAQHSSRGNNAYGNGNGVYDVNVQGLSSNLNSVNSENNHFISGQSENSQNSHSNQNINNNAHVAAVENLELNNEFNLNQGVQNNGDNQRTVKDNAIMGQQKNEVNSRCGRGLVPNARGACVHPEVSRNIFVYAAPKMSHDFSNTSSEVPRPKIEYNLVFVRTPKGNGNGEPIIVPPPQQKTLVYVLSKMNANGTQEIIEVPAGPKHNPEVYYVNYEEGDNPILPGGIELETALNTAVQTGQTVNDIISDSLLREDMFHDNFASTDSTGSIIKDTMFNGIDLHETAERNHANTFSNNPNIEETYNNDGNANNQLGHTYNMAGQSITGVGSDIDFINNGVGLNTAGRITPHSVGSVDGPLPTGDLEVPLGNGINTGSALFVTNGEGPHFRQALPTPPRSYNIY